MPDLTSNGRKAASDRSRLLEDWFETYHPDHWRSLSTRQKLIETLRHPRKQARKVKNALLNVFEMGALVRKRYGIGYPQQFLHQLWVDWAYGFSISDYYSMRFYLPDRWKSVSEYLPTFSNLHSEVIKRTSPQERVVADDKLAFYRHCRSHGIPTLPVIAEVTGEAVSPVNGSALPPRCDLFVKPRNGLRGLGAALFRYKDGEYVDTEGNIWSWDALCLHLRERARSGAALLIQPAGANHPSWQGFTSGALATVRLITARLPDSQKVELLSGELKMPTGSSIVDNIAAGGICSPIAVESGELEPARSRLNLKKPEGYSFHPDTGARIKGEMLPHWPELVQAGIDAHRSTALPFVGWDIALTADGPSVVEANAEWCIHSFQFYDQPISQTRFAELYIECMHEAGQNAEASSRSSSQPQHSIASASRLSSTISDQIHSDKETTADPVSGSMTPSH